MLAGAFDGTAEHGAAVSEAEQEIHGGRWNTKTAAQKIKK